MVDIESIWKELQDEAGVSMHPNSLGNLSKKKCSHQSKEARKASEKLSIIQNIRSQCSTKFDFDTSASAIIEAGLDFAPSLTESCCDGLDADIICNLNISSSACCDSDDDSDDGSGANQDDSTSKDSIETIRIERLVGHFKSDDPFSRVAALNKLKHILDTLMTKCSSSLPELNFPPPYDESKINLERNLPLVSDLAIIKTTAPQYRTNLASEKEDKKHCSLTTYEDAASREAKDKLQSIMNSCGRILFQLIGDKSEKCRNLSLDCLNVLFLSGSEVSKQIPYLMSAWSARFSGNSYDSELEVFVADDSLNELYKRGGAIDRQDRDGLLSQGSRLQLKLVEPSEELRLKLCHTLSSLLRGVASRLALPSLDAYYADMIFALQSCLKDPFPDVKVAACKVLVQLLRIPQWETGAKFFATGLARSVLLNLRHRKPQVIIAAMDLFEASVCVPNIAKKKGAGSSAIADLVGFREENVLPIAAFYDSSCAVSVNTLAELASHNNHRVRASCCKMLSNFLVFLPDRYDHQQRLLPYILSFINDASPAVQCKALRCIEQCGMQYEREHPDDVIERLQLGVDGSSDIDYDSGLPQPFSQRPSLGARLFVRSNTGRFYMAILGELSNWKGQTRRRSADLLLILVVYCEEHLTKDFHMTIASIAKAVELEIKDENESAHLNTLSRIEQVLSLLSKYIDPSAYLSLLMSKISGGCSYSEDGVHSEKSRLAHLMILASLLRTAPLQRLISYWQDLLSLLTNESCIGTYVGSRIQSKSLKTLAVLNDRVMNNTDLNALVASNQSVETLKMAQEQLLLHSEDARATECSNTIARLLRSATL
eukprot:scaffold5772_cov55-Cyclotella_meneghiniana.AAC.5